MELTQEERAILAHVVLDPDAWVAHALATVGEDAVWAKIERWRRYYEAEKEKPEYKNRVARDEAEAELRKPDIEAMKTEALIQAKMREQAVAALQVEGKLTAEGKVVAVG